MRPLHPNAKNGQSIYLDHAATTPVLPDIANEVLQAMTVTYGNPSSPHRPGIEAEHVVRQARDEIAASLGVLPKEVVFTSGGTEGNNMALIGVARARQGRGRHIVTTPMEHSSVLNPLSMLLGEGFEVTMVDGDETGLVCPDDLAAAIRPDTILVSVATVNNEIGTINPIQQLAKVAQKKSPHVLFHSDAVQAFGKIALSPKQLGAHLLTVSGHKLHAPKGIGALWMREGVHFDPLLFGGGQEGGLRSGTENVPGIVGLAAAVRTIHPYIEEREESMRQRRTWMIESLKEVSDSRLNGRTDQSAAPHIINFSFEGIRGEVLVRLLASKGVYVSTGSACSSRQSDVSHVLKSLGIPDWAVEGSIRISLSPLTPASDVEKAADLIKQSVSELRMHLGTRGRRSARMRTKR